MGVRKKTQCLAVVVTKTTQVVTTIGLSTPYGWFLHQRFLLHHLARPDPLIHPRVQHDKNLSNAPTSCGPTLQPSPTASTTDISEFKKTNNLFDNNPFEYKLTPIKMNPSSPTFTPTISYPYPTNLTLYLHYQTPQFWHLQPPIPQQQFLHLQH